MVKPLKERYTRVDAELEPRMKHGFKLYCIKNKVRMKDEVKKAVLIYLIEIGVAK